MIEAAVGAAKHDNMALSHIYTGARHYTPRNIFTLSPGIDFARIGIGFRIVFFWFIAGRRKFIYIREKLHLCITSHLGIHPATAYDVETIGCAVVLC